MKIEVLSALSENDLQYSLPVTKNRAAPFCLHSLWHSIVVMSDMLLFDSAVKKNSASRRFERVFVWEPVNAAVLQNSLRSCPTAEESTVRTPVIICSQCKSRSTKIWKAARALLRGATNRIARRTFCWFEHGSTQCPHCAADAS